MAPPKGTSGSGNSRPVLEVSPAVLADSRFAKAFTDPRFRHLKRKDAKVKIDPRFKSMFTDKSFVADAAVDKYGRKIQTKKGAGDLKRFYRLDSDDEEDQDADENADEDEDEDEDEDDVAPKKATKKTPGKQTKPAVKKIPSRPDELEGNEDEDEEDEDEEDEEDVEDEEEDEMDRYDPMRGEGVIESGDESMTDTEDDEIEEEVDLHEETAKRIGVDAKSIEGEETNRLALMKMDWDVIKAVDIMKMLDTFKPAGGVIRSVKIYPSEFGLERMKRDEIEGPPKDLFISSSKKSAGDGKKSSVSKVGEDHEVDEDGWEMLDGEKADDDDDDDDVEEEDDDDAEEEDDDDVEEEDDEDDEDDEDMEGEDEVQEDDDDDVDHQLADERKLKELTSKAFKEELFQEDKGQHIDNEKLRQYELERMMYYYAVIECDSVRTAVTIYKQCDGTEFERSANIIDLRFIPAEMTFETAPKDACFEVPANYQPKDFVNTALQHSKVKLKWDEDDPERMKMTRRKFTKEDLEQMDFKAYLASDSSGSEDEAIEIPEGVEPVVILPSDFDAPELHRPETKKELRSKYRRLLDAMSDDIGEVVGGKKKSLSGGNRDDDDDDDDDDDGEEEEEEEEENGDGEDDENKNDEREDDDIDEEEDSSNADGVDSFFKSDADATAGKSKKAAGAAKPHARSKTDDFQDMEITFSTGLAEKVEQLVKKKQEDKERANETVFEAYLRKRKEKKKEVKTQKKMEKDRKLTEEEKEEESRRKAELELLMMEEVDEDKEHFNMKDIIKRDAREGKKKRKNDEDLELQENFELNVKDPRFAALYDSPLYAIDPTSPQFKKTKGMSKILEERHKRQLAKADEEEAKISRQKVAASETSSATKDAGLSSLINSIKRKTTESAHTGVGKRTKIK